MTPLDAAACAWFDRIQSQRLDEGRKRPDGLRWQWGDLTEHDRSTYRALVRPIVEAVLAALTTATERLSNDRHEGESK